MIANLQNPQDGLKENSYLLDLFDVALFIIDTDGDIIYSNKTFSSLFKGNLNLNKNNFFKLLSSPPAKDIFTNLKTDNFFGGEISWAKGTATAYGDLRLKAVDLQDKQVLVGSLRDITHRKNNERQKSLLMRDTLSELSAAQDMLMESTKLATIGKLSLEINHELQVPLQVIVSSQSFLKDRLAELNIDDEEINSILKESNTAAAKIRRQLDLLKSKADSSSVEAEEEINSGEVLLNSVSYFSHRSQSRKVKIHTEIKKNFTVKANYDKFENVILNLIRNSLDAFEASPISDTDERYIKVSSFEDSNLFSYCCRR
ncbi:hypothetical protein M901_2866 [Bacteriovorax sp. DB6_IX]|nr:hypothetical protein M901_2866 [Bacteriovorax sp. DB6_IX]